MSATTAGASPSIHPSPAPLPGLFDLWRHRRLALQLVRREVEARYRGSALGLLWSFLHPVLLLGIYTFVFGIVLRARWSGSPDLRLTEFALILFCGLIAFNLFAECVGRAPGLIVASSNYVKKVVFPLEILPLVALGSALFNATMNLTILVLARLVLDKALPWTVVLAPVVLIPLVLLTAGVAWFLASLGVFLRDLSQVIGLMLQALVFLSPVFYPLEAVPAPVRGVMAVNPLSAVVEDLRRVVLFGALPEWSRLGVSLVVGLAAMFLGHAWFMKTKRAFADVI